MLVMSPTFEPQCIRERGSTPKRGRHSTIVVFHRMHLCSGSLMVWQSTPRKWFLGARFLGAPPISLSVLGAAFRMHAHTCVHRAERQTIQQIIGLSLLLLLLLLRRELTSQIFEEGRKFAYKTGIRGGLSSQNDSGVQGCGVWGCGVW